MIQAGILQPVDYVGLAQRGFQMGQQQRREADTDRALRALMANPDDPKAISMLGNADPAKGMAYQGQRREQAARKAEEMQKLFGHAARAAKTPEQWDAIAGYLAQNGVPEAANVVGKFSPEMRTAFMVRAGVEEDKDPAATVLQRNYEYLSKINPQLAESYLKGQAEGSPIVQRNEDGTLTVFPRTMLAGAQGAQGGPQPGAVEDGYRFRGGNPADPNAWEPVNGGPTPQASGGFPSAGN